MKTFLLALFGVSEWLLVLYALTHDSHGARNLVYFLAALSSILFIPTLFMAGSGKHPDNRSDYTKYAMTFLDITECGLIIWFGWWWVAAGYVLGSFASAALRWQYPEKL